jgi:hypothetical protein
MRATESPKTGPFGAVVKPALPIGVGHDGAASHFVEGDLLRGVAGAGGQGHEVVYDVGIHDGPLECLHAPHGTADHRMQGGDAEVIQQFLLGRHHVRDGDEGKVEAERFAGLGIDVARTGGTGTTADDVGTNHEIFVRIQRLARADQGVPPADFGRAWRYRPAQWALPERAWQIQTALSFASLRVP